MTNEFVPQYNNNNYGYTYGVAKPQARNTQPLTQEQITKLRSNSTGFDMKVDQIDLLRAVCTHKEKNGASALIQLEDGRQRCTICGEEFNLVTISDHDLEEKVNGVIDILQTIKTIYLDIPDKLAEGYFQLIPLLKKLLALWKLSVSNFSQYENYMDNPVNTMGPGYSGFAAMQTLLTNPYSNVMTQPYYQQPIYSAPQQPVQPQYNMYQQPVAPAQAPNYNPMAYGAPQQPVAPAPGVIPGAPQPAPQMVTPTAPVAEEVAVQPQQTVQPQGEIQQQSTFNV